jgi:hypothetical protein
MSVAMSTENRRISYRYRDRRPICLFTPDAISGIDTSPLVERSEPKPT